MLGELICFSEVLYLVLDFFGLIIGIQLLSWGWELYSNYDVDIANSTSYIQLSSNYIITM